MKRMRTPNATCVQSFNQSRYFRLKQEEGKLFKLSYALNTTYVRIIQMYHESHIVYVVFVLLLHYIQWKRSINGIRYPHEKMYGCFKK